MRTYKQLLALIIVLAMAGGCNRGGGASSEGQTGEPDRTEDAALTDTGTLLIGDSVAGTSSDPYAVYDSDYVGDPTDSAFDPAVDPGIDPVFLNDPDLNRTEVYTYTKTQPGDHDLPEGIVPLSYDVTGAEDLQAVLTDHLTALQNGFGLALYLENGNELNDTDLDFLQHLNLSQNGWPGLTNLDTLHVYNLKKIPAGVESTNDDEVAYGIPHPYLWRNGWQGPDSEIMKGDGGWVKHIVMDDLEEIPAGAFCDTMFESMSFKGVKIVRQMGLGFAPRAPATYLYMPSLIEAEQHAFRRRQRILKYNFPRLTTLGPFAIDDNSRMQYINAPSLINPPTGDVDDRRNTFNDPRDLISFNFPRIEYLGLSSLGGTNDTTTVFRFPSMINLDGSSLRGHTNMWFVWAPEATRIGPNVFIGDAALEVVYAPKVTDVGRYAFQNCTSLTHIELPGATRIRFNAFEGATALEEVHLPNAETLEDQLFIDLVNLKRVYLGALPPAQGSDVFLGTSPELTIYHSGDDAAWESWQPAGNPAARVVSQ